MDYQIQTQFQGPGFVAVPNAVAQCPDLSAEALGVLVYLASLPHGTLARVATIRERFGFGKDKWQRIARELREAGAMELRSIRGNGGHVIGKMMAVQWPDVEASKEAAPAESRETRHSDREPGNPAVGKPATESRKTRKKVPENPAPYKEEINTRARTRTHARLAEVPTRMVDGRRQYLGPDGRWYGRPSDPAEVRAFEAWICKEAAVEEKQDMLA